MAGAVGAGIASGGLNGIFGTLSEIIDEVGDTLQAIIEATSKTYIINRDVTHRKVVYITHGHRKGKVKEVITTTDHWQVTLFELLLAGLIAGVWELTKDSGGNGKWGLSWKKGAMAALLGPLWGPLYLFSPHVNAAGDIETGLPAPEWLPSDLLTPGYVGGRAAEYEAAQKKYGGQQFQ